MYFLSMNPPCTFGVYPTNKFANLPKVLLANGTAHLHAIQK